MGSEVIWSTQAMESTRFAADRRGEMTQPTLRMHEQSKHRRSRANDVQTEQNDHGLDAGGLKHDLDEILEGMDALPLALPGGAGHGT